LQPNDRMVLYVHPYASNEYVLPPDHSPPSKGFSLVHILQMARAFGSRITDQPNGKRKPLPLPSFFIALFFPFPPIIVVNCFIILRISSNCFNRRLTSCSVVPLPFAIRLRRLVLMISGRLRSSRVIDLIIASVRAICFSSTLRSLSPLA